VRDFGRTILAASEKRATPRKRKPVASRRTYSMIKPDATARNLTGAINARFEAAGPRIIAQKRLWLSKARICPSGGGLSIAAAA